MFAAAVPKVPPMGPDTAYSFFFFGCLTQVVCFQQSTDIEMPPPRIVDDDETQPTRRLLVDEDKEAMIDISRQVQELFHRLDIPIDSIPLGSALPWKSFETLLLNHTVRRGDSAQHAEKSRQSYLEEVTRLNKRKHTDRARQLSSHEGGATPTRGAGVAHGTRSALSPINVGKTKLMPIPSSSSARGEHKSSNGPPTSPRQKRGTIAVASVVAPQESGGESATAYNPAVHSLSLMLVNDATHIPTIDSTLHDMQVAIRRMDGMTQALSTGQSFRHRRRETTIEPGVIYDPELRQIADLQRSIEILRGDVATQASTIRRLEAALQDKRLLIAQLREDLSVYRSKDPFSGEELEPDNDSADDDADVLPFLSNAETADDSRSQPPYEGVSMTSGQSMRRVSGASSAGGSSPPQSARRRTTVVVPGAANEATLLPSSPSTPGFVVPPVGSDGCQSPSHPVELNANYSFVSAASAHVEDNKAESLSSSPPAPFLAPATSGMPTTPPEVSGGSPSKPPATFSLLKKDRRGMASSLKERFQNAVSKAIPVNRPRASPLAAIAAAFGRNPVGEAGGQSAANLRSRLSISAVVAFREAVVDSISRHHIVLGMSTFDSIKRAAMYEASMVDRLISKVSSTEVALQPNSSTLRRVASLRRESAASSFSYSPSGTLSTDPSDTDTAFDDALNFFSTAALRILSAPNYVGPRATPFAPELFFLGVAISHKTLVADSLDPSVWSYASQQTIYFIESNVRDFGGFIVSDESQEYLIVFDNARAALQCALEIQFQLANTTSISWPAELEPHPLAGATRDLTSNNDKRYLWRGLRLGMCIDVVTCGSTTCVRDICDNGGVVYNGYAARVCQWAAAKLAPAGSILLQDRMRPYISQQLVELEDPTVEFWTWRFLPGATAPVKLFDLYHRCQSARRHEHHHTMRLLYLPLQLRVLTDPDVPATLERYVTLHNQAAAKQGIKPVSREDDSILGLEGTVEQRLNKLRELPAPTSEDLVRPGHEEVFLGHVPMLPSPPTPTDYAKLPNGDVCLIVIVIPSYDDVVRFVDDALASSYARRIFRTVRELALKQEFGSLHFVRCRRDRMLFVTPEPMDAIRFALVLQDQLFQLSPWPRDGSLPPGLISMLEPRKINGKLIAEGPAVHCSLHYSKAKPMIEQYSLQQAYYVGSEVDLLEHMTCNAPECTHSVFLSDTMFALYYAREKELTLPQPFVECVGLLGRPNEPLRALYSMTPRFLVARLSLYPSACWFWYKRWVARKQLLDANSGGGRRSSVGTLATCTPGSGVEHATIRFAPLCFSPTELRAMRRYYSAADKVHRERQLLPSYAALAASNTITSTKTQTICAKMFFDGSRRENRIQGTLLAAAASLATNRGRREDFLLVESVERSAMELHDVILPPVALGRDVVGPSVDFAAFVELAGMGGASGQGSAFVHIHHGSNSSMSTPKSSNHHFNRSASSRGGHDQPRRMLHPPPFNLNGPSGGHNSGHTPRGDDGGLTPAEASMDNHEVRALYEIDKERQFMVQRSKKMEAEVRVAHHAVNHFVHHMEGYVGQLLSSQSKRISDEEFMLQFMRKIHQVRDQSKKHLDSDEDEEEVVDAVNNNSSDEDDCEPARKRSIEEEDAFQRNLERVRINETWQDALASVVDHDSDGGDYDPVLLCRSMVGLLCRHFLSLRTVSRRMQRVNDALERAQRTMDPSTKIGKAVEIMSEVDMRRRELEMTTSTEQASRVMQLGAIEESDIAEAMARTASNIPREATTSEADDD